MKWFLLTDKVNLEPLARTVYESQKITRLDQILNKIGIGQSKVPHPEFCQKTKNGKLFIEPCPLAINAYDDAEHTFKISINIWSCKRISDQQQWKRIRSGNPDMDIQIHLHRNVDEQNFYKFYIILQIP